MPLSELVERVKRAGTYGFGEFGCNDLVLEILEHDFLFCNDTDIHIRFEESTPTIEHFFGRWKELGYKPAEWLKDSNGKSVKQIR